MSRKSTAPNTKKAAKQYIDWLASLGVADKIYVAGSRSPLRKKKEHKDSDWDLVIETSIKNLKLTQPRVGDRLHADLLILKKDQIKHQKKIAEVYPKDNHKIFKNVKKYGK